MRLASCACGVDPTIANRHAVLCRLHYTRHTCWQVTMHQKMDKDVKCKPITPYSFIMPHPATQQ